MFVGMAVILSIKLVFFFYQYYWCFFTVWIFVLLKNFSNIVFISTIYLVKMLGVVLLFSEFINWFYLNVKLNLLLVVQIVF